MNIKFVMHRGEKRRGEEGDGRERRRMRDRERCENRVMGEGG